MVSEKSERKKTKIHQIRVARQHQANSTSTMDLSPSAREISPSHEPLIGLGAPPSIRVVRLRGLIRHGRAAWQDYVSPRG
jgi:hypothetical protein